MKTRHLHVGIYHCFFILSLALEKESEDPPIQDEPPFSWSRNEDFHSNATTTTAFDRNIRIGCPDGWLEHSSQCYKHFQQEIHWQPAEDTCIANQAHLVSIHDKATNDFLTTNFGSEKFWIGGRTSGSSFSWSDGTTWDMEIWEAGNPSGDGHCLESHSGFWNDLPCHTIHKRRFVCQKGKIEKIEKGKQIDTLASWGPLFNHIRPLHQLLWSIGMVKRPILQRKWSNQ